MVGMGGGEPGMFAMVAFFLRVGEGGVKEGKNERQAVATLLCILLRVNGVALLP